jgi:hypothetical protein
MSGQQNRETLERLVQAFVQHNFDDLENLSSMTLVTYTAGKIVVLAVTLALGGGFITLI